ncbi:MAG: SEC-C metal-binding domain-containing protein [Candidatus Asgardarchaeia archaeon]
MSKNKIGRNEKCPCGSDRKYKHCCLKEMSEIIDREQKVRRAIDDYDKKSQEREKTEEESVQGSIEESKSDGEGGDDRNGQAEEDSLLRESVT